MRFFRNTIICRIRIASELTAIIAEIMRSGGMAFPTITEYVTSKFFWLASRPIFWHDAVGNVTEGAENMNSDTDCLRPLNEFCGSVVV